MKRPTIPNIRKRVVILSVLLLMPLSSCSNDPSTRNANGTEPDGTTGIPVDGTRPDTDDAPDADSNGSGPGGITENGSTPLDGPWPFADYSDGDAGGWPFGDGFWGEDGVWYQAPEFCHPPPFPEQRTCTGQPGLWGKALQMALWFFNINKSGDGVYCTDVQWRGNAHTSDARIRLVAGDPDGVDMSTSYIHQYRHVFDPDNTGTVDLSGGYYDAGDFIKFALTTGYMAHTIAWAMYEFPSAFRDTGLEGEALEQITWAADYFIRNTFIENKSLPVSQWNVIGYAHQVGGGSDHTCGWMPPELRDPSFCPRMGYFATHEKPAADVTANNAAALALVYLLTRETRPDYAQNALNHAIALYNFAAQYPGTTAQTTDGLYVSEYDYDDLAWAAAWLYEATRDETYFEEAIEWTYRFPGFSRTCVEQLIQWNSYSETNACWSESWTHVWNSLRSGVFVRLAASMTAAGHPHGPLFQMIARIDTMGWVDGPHSPQGFAQKVNVGWGSGRYNSAGQMVALVYAKYFPQDSASPRIREWAARQSRYLLGDNQVNGNPAGKSFMMGFTELSPHYPLEPHHAAGHASIYGEPDNPTENRHILWGALVNGPIGNDTHIDERGDFGSNEVTIDYNAAFVAALAGNYVNQGDGQCPDPNFPPIEPRIDEFYTMARLNNEGSCRTQVEITMINESIHPPRYNEHLTARYYIDITDLAIPPEQMTANIIYDNGAAEFGQPTRIEGPFPCETNGTMWYFVLNYEGQQFWGRQVRLKGPRTTLVDFGVPDTGGCVWDPSNDWSYEDLTTTVQKTPHITAYGQNNKLLWGTEPACHEIRSVIWVE